MEEVKNLLPRRNSFSNVAIAYDPELHLQMKADTVNNASGDLKGLDCPKCKNKGFVVAIRDKNMLSAECSCMDIRRCIRKMEESGLKQVIREMTFEAYEAKEEWQKQIKQCAMAYAQKPEGWFMLSGQSGTGKTHLCTAICRKLLYDGIQVRYMPWREEIAGLKAMSLDSEGRNRLMEELKNAQVLYIDDLFKGGTEQEGSNPTAADGNLAFEILNYRDHNRLPTLISTEKQPEELLEIDSAIAGRIYHRCGSFFCNIKRDQKKNYRLRNIVSL